MTTAGIPEARPAPSAAKPAVLSSWKISTEISRFRNTASANGVLRLPGATIAWRTPARTHSSTRVAQNVADMAPVVVMSPIVRVVRIDIWSDVVCPWCYIGKRRFDTALERLKAKGLTEHIEVVYRSYQLDPSAPTSSTTPAKDAYAKKFGGQERAEQILRHVTQVAAQDDIVFNMDQALRANTSLAHRVLHWILLTYGHNEQARCKEGFLAAYFTLGLNIGDLGVLTDICQQLSIDITGLSEWLASGGGEKEFAQDLLDAAARDITAVPSFVINDQFIIPGAQDVAVFEQVLEKMLSR